MLGCTPWALLFPLPLDKKEATMLKSRLHFGGAVYMQRHTGQIFLPPYVACLLGYPWSMLHVCWVIPDSKFFAALSGVFGVIDCFLLPGFASFMTPQKTPSPTHISSCIRVWNLSVSYLQTTSYSVTLSRRLAEERRLLAQGCERNKTSGSEPNEVITHSKASSMSIKLESILPWPSSPTMAN